jgi:hypothetical protein
VSVPSAPTATTSEPVPAATTTEPIAPTVDLTTLTVVVRNGTGISGLAGKVSTELTAAGFGKATTGNSDPQTDTEIYIRADVRDAVVATLNEKLPSFLAGAVVMEKEPTSADIVIILGHE